MRLGLVAYAENTGLGSHTKALYDHLQPASTLLLDRSFSRGNAFFPERYPHNRTIIAGLPTHEECNAFLDVIDLLLLCEVSPTRYLMIEARSRGIKTVLLPNYEYLNLDSPVVAQPDFYLLPSKWHYDDVPDPKMYFPMPLTLDIAESSNRTAKNFLHIAGRPIFPDRNGTISVFEALPHVTSEITVTIRCQVPGALEDTHKKRGQDLPPNVTLVLDSSDHPDSSTLYAAQDVLLMPRRFGGLCLPVNEALGRGLPVVMPDISPNNQWLPKHWLVPATKMAERKLSNTVDVYDTDPVALAALIDQFATNANWFAMSRAAAAQLAEDYSWERLHDKFMAALQSVLS